MLWNTYEAEAAAAREWSLHDLETHKICRQNRSPQAQGASSFRVKVLARKLIYADCTETPAFWYNRQLSQRVEFFLY